MKPGGPEPAASAHTGPRRAAVDPRRLLLALGLVFCLSKLLLLSWFTFHTRFVMDEYNLVSSALLIEEGFYSAVDPVKTVLQVYFYDVARLWTEGSVELMLASRLQSLLLALLVVVLVYRIARRLGWSRTEALFSVCVLLAFSNFMERSFRIRSEPLAIFLPLLALWLAVRRPNSTFVVPLAAGVLVGGSFLATQKSVYYALAFGLAYLALHLREWDVRKALTSGAALTMGWATSLLAYSLYFGGWEPLPVIRMVFSSPMEAALYADDAYSNLGAFLVQTLTRNELAYGLCFSGVVLALWKFRRLGAAQALGLGVTTVISVLVLLHNQPWPYLFVMAIPFLVLWGVYPLRALGLDGRTRDGALLVLLAILSLSLIRNVGYLDHTNADQIRVMAEAESLLDPGDRYADGVGMIPTRRWAGDVWVWDAMTVNGLRGAARAGDHSALEAIFADQPKLWIFNYRVEALSRLLAPYIESSYVPVSSNVLLTGCVLTPGEETEFIARWPGTYRLYDRQGEALDVPFELDGDAAGPTVLLGLGRHRLKIEASTAPEGALLLPDGLTLAGPLPHSGPPLQLFAQVYT